MNKAAIIKKITKESRFTKLESMDIVESLFEIIKQTLESGEPLRINGFGKFVVKEKARRKGRNPQTGEEITVDARRRLTFKPCAILKSAINGPDTINL